ncbi:LysE family translocator [Leeia sp. TBRC 13508]|uniref:LysE family translocator n=1 Tax=Leeia speluncae TaxID=2884804 RepID=A0ABS8D374_9NEIS|nr:LysE family translocator [Leeia speluncae]MCB6182656.1 LysE family translocator [Leeia speluncae]
MWSICLSMSLFALTGAITPGPVNLMAIHVGARGGAWRAIPYVAGASVSYVMIVWLVGAGILEWMTGLDQASMQWMQGIGLLYMVYLAWKIATAPVAPLADQSQTKAPWWAGAMMQILNPKAWLFAMSGISLFVLTSKESWRLAIFCSLSGLICFFSIFVWAYAGQSIRHYMGSLRWQRGFNRIMGFALIASISLIYFR